MTFITAQAVRSALLRGEEIAIVDVREEAEFALGHPLFAAQIPLRRIATEAHWRIPRRDVLLAVYDDQASGGQSLADEAAERFQDLGYEHVRVLKDGLSGWRNAGYELFEDVNSYAKAFGELVEHRRHTPSLTSPEVKALIDQRANIVVLDARRFDEYTTMSIPTGISVPGAELVLNARDLAPDPETTIVVNCAGRTRSIIGTQSLINAGIPNRVVALRNGTIGWTLAGQSLETGQTRRGFEQPPRAADEARDRARNVAYRAGVKRLTLADLDTFKQDTTRTLYLFDVRQKAAFEAGHINGIVNVPGGQLVQETDHYAPVRGARIVLSDDVGPRADMSASWLAQMGWEVYVLDGGFADDADLRTGLDGAPPPRGPEGRYRRPYEGTQNKAAAMQAYLDWEYGLVDQLARDATHGFYVI